MYSTSVELYGEPTSQGCSRAQPSAFAAGQGLNSAGTAAFKAELKIDTTTSTAASKLVTRRLMGDPAPWRREGTGLVMELDAVYWDTASGINTLLRHRVAPSEAVFLFDR
jgi:hypothetical protein